MKSVGGRTLSRGWIRVKQCDSSHSPTAAIRRSVIGKYIGPDTKTRLTTTCSQCDKLESFEQQDELQEAEPCGLTGQHTIMPVSIRLWPLTVDEVSGTVPYPYRLVDCSRIQT